MNKSDHIYGNIPAEWRYTTVDELVSKGLADLQTGPFGTALLASEYVSVGTPVVAVKNIGQNKLLLDDDIPRVNEAKRQELIRYSLHSGDIIFGRKGAVDRRAIVTPHEEGWLQGSDCIRLRFLSPDFDPVFISYVLGTPQYVSWVVRNAGGSTMPSLNQRIVGRVPLPLPPPEEQRAIAHVLGTLDDKIELNRQMNETLEAMARAIFKSWFVDFDPAHAKANGEQPIGMDAETAALFPDSFEPSELGDIPSGWSVKSLDEIAHYQNGLAIKKYPPESADYLPALKIRELRQGYFDENSDLVSSRISEECIVYDGDMIFSWSGSLLVDLWTGGMGALNQHLFKVTSETFPQWFYYFWTKYHLDEFIRIAGYKATTMGHIKRSHLSEALTAVPPLKVINELGEFIEPLLDLILNNRFQSNTLAQTRDQLLPKLVTGELRVDEF